MNCRLHVLALSVLASTCVSEPGPPPDGYTTPEAQAEAWAESMGHRAENVECARERFNPPRLTKCTARLAGESKARVSLECGSLSHDGCGWVQLVRGCSEVVALAPAKP